MDTSEETPMKKPPFFFENDFGTILSKRNRTEIMDRPRMRHAHMESRWISTYSNQRSNPNQAASDAITIIAISIL